MNQKINCPYCHNDIDLDKIADEKYFEKLKEQELKLKDDQEKQKIAFEKEMKEKEDEMRKKAIEFAEKKANEERKKVEIEMKDMNDRLVKAEAEQQEMRKKELDFMRKHRELEDKEKNFELEMEKKMIDERKKIELNIAEKMQFNSKKEMDEKLEKIQEEFRKKELEYQKQQEQLKKSLDDAKRKAEQWSQQIQWDIQEEDLKNSISQAFPIDSVSDVATWIKWADIIQVVKNNIWIPVWTIVWESKNTKAWQDSWLMKLKEDKLKVNWNIAILVTSVLPKDLKNFWMQDDIMVCLPEFAIVLASILRDKLLSMAKLEKSQEWKDIKMEMLYKYLSSEEFSSKILLIWDVFTQMKSWIDSERRVMEKIWKKREKDLELSTCAISWMYWELESLMGQSLPWSEKLTLWAWYEN